MSATERVCQTTVAWNNPYTEPPNGLPRVLHRFEGLPPSNRDLELQEHPAILLIAAYRSRGVTGYGLHLNLWWNEPPRKKLAPEVLQRRRKLNLHRRALKKYGFLAREFIDREYATRGYTWGEEDEAIWLRAQVPPKPSKIKKLKAAKRKTDNDELLKGTP